jgi:hypothetical protein
MRVLRHTWAVVSAQGWNPGHHLIGQLTECEHDGVMFWVREALDKRTSFTTSSNQRSGEKCKAPSPNRQALELCCPAENWDRIVAVVREADTLKRPVLQNRHFTLAWIKRQWTNDSLGWSARQRAALPHDLVICGYPAGNCAQDTARFLTNDASRSGLHGRWRDLLNLGGRNRESGVD